MKISHINTYRNRISDVSFVVLKSKKMKKLIFFELLLMLLLIAEVNGQSIINTKHNMSVSGPGTVKATSESEICLFCHTPHNSRPVAPLWNRNDPGTTYIPYNSSTMQALPGQPDGSSILCLSCHDGTVALGNVLSRSTPISFTTGDMMPAGVSNLSNNLSNDHPVSFLYNSSLATADRQLKSPTNITPPVSLEMQKMQCTSCHDPHKNIYSDFLVTTTQNSNLCNSCHQRDYWTSSSHSTSTKTWNGIAPNPWPYTTWTTVAQNACENCHNPHNSGDNTLNLKYQAEENNCNDCHNGNAASKNIYAQFAKTYKHNIVGYQGVHDANEAAQVTNMHVECVDCHNPHASNNQTAVAPAVRGSLIGVKGINQSGNPVNPAVNSYEICYRCHAGSPGAPPATIARVISQNNTRLEFASGNPSYHSVAATGVNTNVPSLIAPWTSSSRMYCSDCHSSDGTGSPAGPHGSIYPHILKRQYTTADNTTESAAAYALCYGCHNRTSILGDISFKEHSKHIVGERTPCSTCHDAHGISSTQGNSTNNSNLINFATSIVRNPSTGTLRFEDQGSFKGRCYLTCHGVNHNPLSY
jgi:predicted CXXCH cytochrome family protein